MTDVDIAKLALLARIAVDEGEMEELQHDLPEILAFVEKIQEAGGEIIKETGEHYNVMREDGEPHESGAYTKDMLSAMPNEKDGYLRVRKIIDQG